MITATNLIQGPAELYVGTFGATEPPATTAGLAAAPGDGWTSVGGTTDGVTLNIAQTYAKMAVDQIVDGLGARLTERAFTVETNMAEATLENLAFALNNLGTIDSTVAGIKSFEPLSSLAETQPTYAAVILDGWAPGATPQRRRVVLRKVLSTEGAEFAYTKDEMTVLAVTLEAYYVSASIKPFRILDANPV